MNPLNICNENYPNKHYTQTVLTQETKARNISRSLNMKKCGLRSKSRLYEVI